MESDYIEFNKIALHIREIQINLRSGSEGVFCAIFGLANIFSISLNTELKGQLELT